jgi:LPXTG-motif cell wall-anchored protein
VKWAAWATWAVAAAVLMLGLIFVLLRRRNRIRQYAP